MCACLKPRARAKLASRVVAAYPFTRGKYFLRQFAAKRFLLGRTDVGHWVRVSGVSGFEWKIFDGRYNEPRTIAAMKRLVRSGMTVFDVGANVGYYSLLAASLVGPSGHVHSFEPTPTVVRRLAENVALNQFSSRVKINAVAVGSTCGKSDFHLSLDDSEANSMFASDQHLQSVCVPIVTLDGYVRDHDVARIDVMKVDIEGAELVALQGASELLRRETAPLLIVEFNPAALASSGAMPSQLKGEIERFGYRCYRLEQLTEGSSAVYNILAIKPSHIPTIQENELENACEPL